MASRFLAAACHISPITLSAVKTTEKCISFVNRAAKNAADLVVFPESYIPAFPVWSALQAPTHNHGFFERMAKESIYIDGDEMHAIRDAAKQTRTVVSVGISEKVRYSTATMFNSNIIIGSDGEILVHHRKLMPTFFEKLTWAPGDGFGLRVANTKFGKIGALICGENTNPLARWPRDLRTQARYDNPAANRNRAVAHCFENKCFGILCAGLLDEASIEEMCSMTDKKGYLESGLRDSSQASTLFLGPTGAATLPSYIVDPVSEEKTEMRYLCKEEDILYAELDLEKCVEGKQYHDVVGGYQRLDVFDLKVDRTRRKPATFTRKSSTRS